MNSSECRLALPRGLGLGLRRQIAAVATRLHSSQFSPARVRSLVTREGRRGTGGLCFLWRPGTQIGGLAVTVVWLLSGPPSVQATLTLKP